MPCQCSPENVRRLVILDANRLGGWDMKLHWQFPVPRGSRDIPEALVEGKEMDVHYAFLHRFFAL